MLIVAICCELKELPCLEQLIFLRELSASGWGTLQSIEGLAQLRALQVLKAGGVWKYLRQRRKKGKLGVGVGRSWPGSRSAASASLEEKEAS